MDIGWILQKKYPEASWSMLGSEYQSLVWHGPGKKPTFKKLEDAWEEVQAEVLNEQASQNRQKAYQQESDPIFFDWQRGDATKQEWLDKIAEIKARYPYSGNFQA